MKDITNELKVLNPHVLNWELFEKYNVYKENDIYYNHCAIMESKYFIPGELLHSLDLDDLSKLDELDYDGELSELEKMSKVQLAFNRINKKYKKKIFDYDIWINHIMNGITSGDFKMIIEETYGKEEIDQKYLDFKWMSCWNESIPKYPYLYVMHNYCAHVYHKHLYEPDNTTKYYTYNYVRGYGYCEFFEDIMWKDGVTAKDIMKMYNDNPNYFTETNSIIRPLQEAANLIYHQSKILKLSQHDVDAFYLLLLKRLISEKTFNKIIVYVINEGSYYSHTSYSYITYRGMVLNPSKSIYDELYNCLDFHYVYNKNYIKGIPIKEYLKVTGIERNEVLIKILDNQFEYIKDYLSYLFGGKLLSMLSKL